VRKLLLGAIAGAVMLAVAAIAMAATDTTYTQTYTNKKAGKSTGTFFKTTSIDSSNTANNMQPSPTRRLTITFPKGTKINQKAAPFCKQLQEDEPNGNVCPKKTKIGDGHAEARLKFNGTAPIPATVTAYNRKKGLWLYIVPQAPGQAPIVLKPKFKGLRLITNVPPLCVLNDCATNGEAVLTEFDLTTKAIKKHKKVFLTTPAKCTKAGWTFKALFEYDPGTPPKPLSFTQKCKK
jgi:predicted Zn-ribbon and HTH transcriptional regulator